MFSHTSSDHHTDTTDTHTKSADVITEPKARIFIHKITSEYKFLHSGMFIRNQTITQPNCWRSGELQQLNQVFPQNKHPKLSLYASLSSSTTFGTTLPPTTPSQKQKLFSSSVLASSYAPSSSLPQKKTSPCSSATFCSIFYPTHPHS
jgi:hypothetical protein